ncbi:unnamed protein product [Paramecium sonneborni]|uniref:Uncharacterized protein n=1 Tax=Paramecium sonneborni TaxID=65129 RepID=A0A8S1R0T7_9CILI|nr:unnamed protein product [Paramecium sonneborni]
MMNYLQDISVANEPMYKVSSNSVNLNFGFLTSKLATDAIGSSIKDNSRNRLLEEELENTNQNYSNSTNFFKFSQTRFIDNPFYSQAGFPKNSSGYSAVDPKLYVKNTSIETKNITSSMKMKFQTTKQLAPNTSTKCIAQINSGNWNANVCKTKKADGETICECESLNPTSIMESLDYLLDKASQVYSLDTLLAFASFPFYKTIAFYFYLFMTGGYAYFVYWGMKVDHVFYTRLAAEKEAKEALEKQLKEEEEKLKEKEQEQILKQEDINNKENQDGIQVEQFDTQNDENQSKAILGQQDFNDVQINQEIGGTIFNKDKEPKLTQIEDNIVREQVPTLVDLNEQFQLIQPQINFMQEDAQMVNDNPHLTVDGQNDTFKSQISPENKIDNYPSAQPLQQDEVDQQNATEQNPQQKKEAEDMVQQSISKIKAYIEYLKYFHQILSIVYQDDEDKPRGLRASIVYTGIMGSLAVLFVFGQPNNISLTLTLALFTAPKRCQYTKRNLQELEVLLL